MLTIGAVVVLAGLYWLSLSYPRLAFFVLAALFLWQFALFQHSHRKRMELASYVAFLLVLDEVRASERADFERWLAGFEAENALALGANAGGVVEGMAARLVLNPSIPDAGQLLWALRSELGQK